MALVGFAASVIHPTTSAADQVASVIGCSVGSTHLYCRDPTILVLRKELETAWPEAQRALGTGAIIDQDTAYSSKALAWGADRICLIEAVAEQAGTLRGWAYPDSADAPLLKPPETGASPVAAPVEVDAAEVAVLLGCDGAGDLAHCSDPSVLRLAMDRITSVEDMIEAAPGMAVADKVDRSMLLRTLERCENDLSCVRQALTRSTESIRGRAGSPPMAAGGEEVVLDRNVLAIVRRAEDSARALNNDRIAAAKARAKSAEKNRVAAAELREKNLVAQAQATEEAYSSEWISATNALAPYPKSLDEFKLVYQNPEAWVKWRETNCLWHSQKLACLAQTTFDRERMSAFAAEQMERGQQAAARAAEIAKELALEAELAERQKRNEAARQKEAAERVARAMAPEELASIFPRDSLLLLLINGDFSTLDKELSEMVAREYAGKISTTIGLFAPGMSEQIRARIIGNRRNLFAASYAVTRFRELGDCGDRVVKNFLRSVSGTETRTLSGRVVDRAEGFDIYIEIPRKFARYIRRTGLDDSDLFVQEVRAMGCQHPARHILESNLVAFAEGRNFIPWH